MKNLFVAVLAGEVSESLIGEDVLLPLAVQHEGFLKLCAAYPNWSFYVSTELRLRGALCVEILQKCLSLVIGRHSSLRIRLVMRDGSVRQRFAPVSEPEYVHVLVIAILHAVSGAISFTIFFKELWSACADLAQGRDPSLPNVVVQYWEYALWQRFLCLPSARQYGDYWASRLSGATPLRMPARHIPASGSRSTTGEIEILLGESLSSDVHELARSVRSTPALIMMALYAPCVSSWCNQNDFILWIGVAGRLRPTHISVMDQLASGFPIRVQLRGDETFIDVLERVSREFITAYESIDFGQCLSAAPPEMFGGTSIAWLGDSIELAGIPGEQLQASLRWDLVMEPVRLRSARIENGFPEGFELNCEMVWEFFNSPRGIAWRGFYRSDLFSADTLLRFTEHLRGRAEQLIRESRVPLATFNTFVSGEVDAPVGHTE